MSRKRKVDADGRPFQDGWEGERMFVLQGQTPVRLLCRLTKGPLYVGTLTPNTPKNERKTTIAAEMCSRRAQRKVAKAGLVVAEEIARAFGSFAGGAFLKQRLLKVREEQPSTPVEQSHPLVK